MSYAQVGKDRHFGLASGAVYLIEDIQSESMVSGIGMGVYFTGRFYAGEDGGQERELASKYRKWERRPSVFPPICCFKTFIGLG
jgi:hypothetical protein